MSDEMTGRGADTRRKRYFAIIVEAEDSGESVLTASTVLMEHVHKREHMAMPAGTRVTRCIEITEQKAQETWK